jgi:uncharacterized protein YndB with AHSA1/START domain
MSIRRTLFALAGVVSTTLGWAAPAGEHASEEAYSAPAAPIEAHMSMHDDLMYRSPEIHWPSGFDPEHAELFAHNERLIHASCERVWSHIVDATSWPTWYPNSRNIRILGGDRLLKKHSVFRWQTFGLNIESRIQEYVPYRRLGWYGYAPGSNPSFYHSWYLEPQGEGCFVVMDEAGIGADAAALRRSDETRMHRGHDLWLTALKWIAELPAQ